MSRTATMLWHAWRGWWFPAVPIERLAVLRVLIGTFVAVELAVFSRFLPRYGDIDSLFADPVLLLRPIFGLTPSSTVLAGLQAVCVVSAVALAFGFFTRYAAVVTTGIYTYEWALFNSFGKVNHGKVPVIMALLVIIVAPAGAAWSVDAYRRRRQGRRGTPVARSELAGWALRVVMVTVVAAYFLSVLGKLRGSGLGWVTAPVLQTALISQPPALARWLQSQPELLTVMQAMTLLIEASSISLLFTRRTRTPLLLAFAAFHLGSLYLIRTEFLGFIFCYAAFYDTEEGVRWLGDRLQTIRPARSLPHGQPGRPTVRAPASGLADSEVRR